MILPPRRRRSRRRRRRRRRKDANSHIPQSNHTNRLPDPQANPRRNPPIQTLNPIIRVDVIERLPDCQILRPIGIFGFTLHLDADYLDRLVPRAQPAAQPTRQDLLKRAQLLSVLLPGRLPDPLLRQPAQPEPRAPVRGLPDGDSVDTAVDAPDAFPAPDVHEGFEGAWRLDALRCDLVFCDLDCLHAGAEPHCGVGLCDAAGHAAGDAADEVVGAE